MGGMHGFGPIVRELDEPVFHAEWERRTFAIALAMMGRRAFNVDEFRRTIEQMPPLQYLGATYYELWLHACESLLMEKGVVERVEIDVVMAALRAGASLPRAPVYTSDQMTPDSGHDEDSSVPSMKLGGGGRSLRYDQSFRPRFKAGDRVMARNLNPQGHTRMPRYVRGHHGIIHRDWGVFVFPDTHAHGVGTKPQHCYAVEFDACDLWGGDHPAGERVYVDLWEDYLDAAATDVRPRSNGSREAVATSAANASAANPARKRTAKKSRSRKTSDSAPGNPVKNDQGMGHE
jgi:nitrile hydratase